MPLEKVHEDIHHQANHGGQNWTMGVALTTSVLAGLAAVAAMLSGHHANEAMLDQIHASDKWAYYQAKGIKAAVLNSKIELLTGLGKEPDPKDRDKSEQYKADQERTKAEAEEKESASGAHMQAHGIYARGVTMFQVAIAVSAISVLTRRRRFWYIAIGFGVIGLGFLAQGLMAAH